MRYTNEGIPYFVDHNSRTTSFHDPRISPNATAGGPAYERSFRWKVGQFRHLCQVMVLADAKRPHPFVGLKIPL